MHIVLFSLQAELWGKISHGDPEIHTGDEKSCINTQRIGCVRAEREKPRSPQLSHSHWLQSGLVSVNAELST